NRMTPTHAVKNGVRYRYYVSRPLITKDQTDGSAGLRISAEEIEQLVTSRVRQCLVDPGSIYQAIPLADPSAPRRLIAPAGAIGKTWSELPGPRQRAFLAALIDRIDVRANQIDIPPDTARRDPRYHCDASAACNRRGNPDRVHPGAAASLRAGDCDADRPH